MKCLNLDFSMMPTFPSVWNQNNLDCVSDKNNNKYVIMLNKERKKLTCVTKLGSPNWGTVLPLEGFANTLTCAFSDTIACAVASISWFHLFYFNYISKFLNFFKQMYWEKNTDLLCFSANRHSNELFSLAFILKQ